MPLQKLPVVDLDNVNHRRGARERINSLLDHSADDWRKQTDAEKLAGVTPINAAFPPGDVRRYQKLTNGTFDVSNTADWTAAIQAAMDSNNTVLLPAIATDGSFYGISAPLYIRDSQAPNLTIVGGGRTNTYLHPLAISISDGLGINAFFINQANDHKFSIRNLRFWSEIAYTGRVLYCVDGAGGGTVQAVFSGSIQDCWFGLASTNSGMINGGLSNFLVSGNVWEFCKQCVILEGAGTSDIVFSDNQLFFCFDEFISKTDTGTDANLITVDNLHIYLHQRGVALRITDVIDVKVSNITMQMVSGVSNLGGGGLFHFDACRNVTACNFITTVDSGFGTGTVDNAITLEDCVGTVFSNGVIDGAEVGIRITGTGTNSVSFSNMKIVRSVSAAFRVVTGSPVGVVSLSNCDLSENTLHGILFSDEATLDLFVSDCRIVNAGLGGSAAARNILISTTGAARFTNCIIGQNSGSAAAGYYIDAVGTAGTPTFMYPVFVGAPPTGIKTGAQAAKFIYEPLLGAATYDPPNLADAAGATTTVTVTGASLGDFANAAFSNNLQGISMTAYVSAADTVSVRFQNESGGALDLASGTLTATTQRLVLL
jgi:hypothetical protein